MRLHLPPQRLGLSYSSLLDALNVGVDGRNPSSSNEYTKAPVRVVLCHSAPVWKVLTETVWPLTLLFPPNPIRISMSRAARQYEYPKLRKVTPWGNLATDIYPSHLH